jgi:hypothetical protein
VLFECDGEWKRSVAMLGGRDLKETICDYRSRNRGFEVGWERFKMNRRPCPNSFVRVTGFMHVLRNPSLDAYFGSRISLCSIELTGLLAVAATVAILSDEVFPATLNHVMHAYGLFGEKRASSSTNWCTRSIYLDGLFHKPL